MIEIEVYARSSVANIPTVIIGVLLTILILGSCFLLWKKGWHEGIRYVVRLMLVEWVVLIFCTTGVFRNTRVESAINLIPLWSYFQYPDNSYLKEMAAINLLNVVMFMPIGFLLKFGVPQITCQKVILVGAILSALTELSQFVFRKGLCEVDDVIHNVLGCVLGYGLCYMILKR